MVKVNISTVSALNTGSALTAINSNFSNIQAAIENTLSRDGTTPNQLEFDFDVNHYRLFNLPEPSSNTEPVLKGTYTTQITDLQDQIDEIVLTGTGPPGPTGPPGADGAGIVTPGTTVVGYLPQWGDTSGDSFTAGVPTNTFATASHNQGWSTITSTPTTISGYGITDAYTKTYTDANFSVLGHTHTFASLTSKPTTLSGFGITDGQPLDADLTAIAALTSAANKGLQSTGTGTWALYDLTTAGKALLDDADAAAQRTTLGLGTAATTASTDYATAAHTHTFASLTSKPTTIAGYGITDSVTSNEASTSDLTALTSSTTVLTPRRLKDRARFSSNKNSVSQISITSGVETKITFTTEVFDVGSFYDNTNSRFTPAAGNYLFLAQLWFTDGLVDEQEFDAILYKNGSALAYGTVFCPNSSTLVVPLVVVDTANGTDYYEIYGSGYGAGDKTVNGDTSSTYFKAFSI